MTYLLEHIDNEVEALALAAQSAAGFLAQGQLPTVLVSSAARQKAVRQAWAETPQMMGVRVETPQAWAQDRWELYGDGRQVVDATVRQLLVLSALRDEGCGLEATPGVIDLAAGLARDALPFILQAQDAQDLDGAERQLMAALARYAQLLERRGLCELSQALVALPQALGAQAPLIVLDCDRLTFAQQECLTLLGDAADVVVIQDECRAAAFDARRNQELAQLLGALYQPPTGRAVQPHGTLRFLLPAGNYAAPLLLARQIEQLAAASAQAQDAPLPVAVACRNPLEAFERLAPRLAERGVSCAVSSRQSFEDSPFGRAFLQLAQFCLIAPDNVQAASDFAQSAFSGMSQRRACLLDAQWRASRLTDHDQVVAGLGEESDLAAAACTALQAADIDAALAAFEAWMHGQVGWDAAYRAAQLGACGAARAFAQAAALQQCPVPQQLALLRALPVSAASRCDAERGNPCLVVFEPFEDTAQRPACSCFAVVLCDLTSAAYPVRAPEDAASRLLGKLGVALPLDPLARMRRMLFHALSAATQCAVLERPLNTADANAAYSAVYMDEVVDCYRVDPRDDRDLDRATGLPACLLPFCQTAGEDELQQMLTLAEGQPRRQGWPLPAEGEVSASRKPRIVLSANSNATDAATAGMPQLSPSALESYLECPYKWFAQRRLRLDELDAGFGPLEMGSFSHAVLKEFYDRLQAQGTMKVTAACASQAQALMGQVFDGLAAQQPQKAPRENPLIPKNPLEQAQMDELRRKLVRFLDREQALLPGFVPAYREYAFGKDKPFAYAGALLNGSIDRIDVNDAGQAVVIDYKGSVSDDYQLASASPAPQAGGALLPHKVQTLMYAQVAQRELGLQVVGALYLSYGKRPVLAGAYDRTVLGPHELPNVKEEACGAPLDQGVPFAQLIDQVEEAIAQAVTCLQGGQIAPRPRGGNPCGWCPVHSCAERIVR